MVDGFFLILLCILFSIAISLAVIVILWLYRVNKSLLHLSEIVVLQDVFNRLGTESHQEARKNVYEAYIDYKKNNDITIFKDHNSRKQAEIVKADFDVIGLLYEYDYLNKNAFFDLYSDTVRRCWIALEHQIKNERKERISNEIGLDKTGNHFMEYFELLAKHAKEYRDKKNLSEPSFIDFRSSNS